MWQSHEPNCKTNSLPPPPKKKKSKKKSLDRRVHFCYTLVIHVSLVHTGHTDCRDLVVAKTTSVREISQSISVLFHVCSRQSEQTIRPWSRHANFDFLCGGLSNQNHVPYTSTPTRPKLQQRSVHKVHTQILTHTRACTHTYNQKRF